MRFWITGFSALATISIRLALALAVCFSTTALADDDSGSARISVASKLNLEARALLVEACNLAHAPEAASAEALGRGIAGFEQKLTGLREGDLALALRAPEAARRVLRAIDEVEAAWVPVATQLRKVARGGEVQADAFAAALNASGVLSEATGSLLAIVSGEYSNAEKFAFGAVMAVNILDRQTLLIRDMALHSCIIRAGLPEATASEAALAESKDIFSASMEGLVNGLPQAGLMAPPTDSVKAALEVASAEWGGYATMLDPASATNAANEEALGKSLENARLLYLLATSKQEDLYRIPLETYAEEQLTKWLKEPVVVLAIRDQNTAHAGVTQPMIDQMDLTWRAEVDSGAHKMIAEMLSRPLSETLLKYQEASGGIVTEVFVMDNKGLNVGQSVVTSDLWQGDEAKFQETFERPEADLHISEVEFDDSTGFYQVQVSLTISDPVTDDAIGAVTFGVNIQSLL